MDLLFEYIKPIIYFLILETVILSVISNKEFQVLIKMFCGIVLAILILVPIQTIFANNFEQNFDLEDAQWKNTLQQYEKIAENGDEFLINATRTEYQQFVVEKVDILARNQGLQMLSCEIIFSEEENCQIQELLVMIQQKEGQNIQAQSMKLKNDVADILEIKTEQIKIKV